MEAMLAQLSDVAEVEIPDVMIEQEAEDMVNDYARRVQQQGIDFNQFLQITGQTAETLKEQMKEDAAKRVKSRLSLEEVVRLEQLNATEEEIEKEYSDIAAAYKMEVEQVKEYIAPENIQYDLKLRKAMEFVKNAAK